MQFQEQSYINLLIDLQKQVDELRATIGTFDKRTDYTGIGGVKIS